MTAARALARAGFRGRLRSVLALMLLAGFVSGATMALLGGARRTVSSVDRLRHESRAADLFVQPAAVEDHVEELRAHPDVAAAGQRGVLFARVKGSDVDLTSTIVIAVAVDDQYLRTVDRPRLLSGSLPDPRDAGAVMVTEAGAAAYGAGVGDELVIESLTPDQVDEFVFEGEPQSSFEGPEVRVRVAGVVRTLGEALDLNIDHLVVTPAFWERYRGEIGGFDNLLLVRTHDGAALPEVIEAVERLWADDPDVFVDPVADDASGTHDLARAHSIALAIAACSVAVAGSVILMQAMSRVGRSLAGDPGVLAALGMTGAERMIATLIPLVSAATAGAVVGALGAALMSGAFPTGRFERVEPSPGLRLDAPLLLTGIGVTLVVSALFAATAARRVARPRVRRPTVGFVARAAARGPAIASAAAHTGTRRGVPARPAVAGAVVALAGAVAAATFGASLDRFVDEPARDGWNWDVEVGVGDELTDDEARTVAREVAADPAVGGVALTRQLSYDVAGREVQIYGHEPIEGSVGLTVVQGRLPARADEVALGATTADTLGVGPGELVELPAPGGEAQPLTVTGLVRFPNIGRDAAADGVLLTLDTLATLAPPDADGRAPGFPTLFVTWLPGADTQEATARLAEQYPVFEPARSSQVLSLGEARGAPAILVVILTVLGLAAIAHALVVSVRLARRDLAVLTTVGFEGRQRALVIVVQAIGYVAAGLAVGVPVGVVVGRSSWRLLAERLGAESSPLVPATVLLAVPVALALVAVTALAPALLAARAKPVVALRAE